MDLVRAPDADVILDERLEEAPSPPWVVQDERAGDLGLSHRELPPVSGLAVGVGERCRDSGDPAIKEAPDVGRTEAVTDRLEAI